ncbi:MAG: hypothetical protein IJV35_01705 [Neisseriaceae bacterium]|nr:hypothetical protein [Neisseriaceae bacterium]
MLNRSIIICAIFIGIISILLGYFNNIVWIKTIGVIIFAIGILLSFYYQLYIQPQEVEEYFSSNLYVDTLTLKSSNNNYTKGQIFLQILLCSSLFPLIMTIVFFIFTIINEGLFNGSILDTLIMLAFSFIFVFIFPFCIFLFIPALIAVCFLRLLPKTFKIYYEISTIVLGLLIGFYSYYIFSSYNGQVRGFLFTIEMPIWLWFVSSLFSMTIVSFISYKMSN